MKQYIVDAFSDHVFAGNQAAVCVMDDWLDEKTMINIAIENRFSETAFTVKEGDAYHLRWFTPGGEIDLCGHATLATGYVLLRFYETEADAVEFKTLSGKLTVTRKGELLEMDFPAYELKEVPVTDEMAEAIGARPLAAYMGRDLLCIMDSEKTVREKTPDMEKSLKLPGLLLHTTAQSRNFDCVSRSFAPKLSIDEDPVCGSGHCHIVPYWAQKLGKEDIKAFQASKRTGVLYCHMAGKRLKMAGQAALFSKGELFGLK